MRYINRLLAFSIVLLVLILGVYIYNMDGIHKVKHLEQAVKISDGERNINIHLWYSEEDLVYYAFLPSYQNEEGFSFLIDRHMSLTLNQEVLLDGNLIPDVSTGVRNTIVLSDANNDVIEESTLVFLRMENTATIYVDTASGSMDYVDKNKDNKEEASISVVNIDGTTEYEGKLDYIKGRGNYTWGKEKKPYNISFKESVPLLGMPAAFKWSLLSDYLDGTSLRNKIIYDFAQEMQMNHAVASNYVQLYLNGNYHGLYLITEKIEIGSNKIDVNDLEETSESINAKKLSKLSTFSIEELGIQKKGVRTNTNPEDITGGYLLELDMVQKKYPSEVSGFVTKEGQAVIINSPEYSSKEQVDYISQRFDEMEEALNNSDGYNEQTGLYFEDYLDVESFVKLYLVEEVFGNVDAGATSVFLYKDSDQVDSKIYAGPIWDYDLSIGNIISESSKNLTQSIQTPYTLVADRPYLNVSTSAKIVLIRQLCEQERFSMHYIDYYVHVMKPMLNQLLTKDIKTYVATYENDIKVNGVRWPTVKEFDEEVTRLIDYMNLRIGFLDSMWLANETYAIVTLDTNKFNLQTSYQYVQPGSTFELPQLHDENGGEIQFLGWYMEDQEVEGSIQVDDSIELQAKWHYNIKDGNVFAKILSSKYTKFFPVLLLGFIGIFILYLNADL